MNKKLLDEVNNITKGILLYDIVILIIAWCLNCLNEQSLSGIAFGSIIAALNLRLLGIAIQKSVNMPPAKAQMHLVTQYTVRMLINAVVLFVSAMGDHISIIATVIGLLSTKFVILINELVIGRIRGKEA